MIEQVLLVVVRLLEHWNLLTTNRQIDLILRLISWRVEGLLLDEKRRIFPDLIGLNCLCQQWLLVQLDLSELYVTVFEEEEINDLLFPYALEIFHFHQIYKL